MSASTIFWIFRLFWRTSITEPQRDVVEAALEQHEQVLTRHATHARGLVVVAAELLLQQAVDALDLLLLAQLLTVVAGALLATLTVLTRGVLPPLVSALVGEATVALEEQLGIFTPAKPAHGTNITCHGSDPPPLGRAATVVGDRRDVLDGRDAKPRAL